ADGAELPATPQYNAAVLGDALLVTHMKYLFETAEMCPEFPRAAALLRVWRSQRAAADRCVGTQKLAGTRRISGFVLTMVLAWLVRSPRSGAGLGPRLAGSMNAHQLFKGAIEFIAAHDFVARPVQFGDDADVAAFGNGGAGVLVDPSSMTNLLAGAQPWELAELRIEARQTALDLNHHSEPQFDRVFLSAALADVTAKYDHVFRLDVDLAQFLSPRHGAGLDVARRMAELECGHPVVAVQGRVARFLGAALQRQTRLVAVHPCADASFGDRTRINRRHVFYIGIVADADEARRLVDLGPNPDVEPQAAASFRAWWGERAELRRFRDGSIRLATVWGATSMSIESRAMILPRMVAYLLRKHVAVHAQPEILHPDDLPGASGGEAAGHLFSLAGRLALFASTRDLAESDADKVTFEAAIGGLDQLQRDIKGVESQLPLRVLALHPVAPGLRYASLAPPKPLALDRGGDDAHIEPLHVLLEFTTSTKWPSDMAALHKVKAAFLLRLAECYTAAHPGAQATAGNRLYGYGAADGVLTGGSPTTLGASADDFDYERDNYLDIRHPGCGLTFRLSILCPTEPVLLEEQAKELRLAGLAPRADALERARRRWLRCNQWRARHHRRILDLCQRHHPAASLTIRLLKRWLSRHMLLGQPSGVPDEVAELVVARVFTDAWAGLAAPASSYAGFVRSLQLLATWRWKDDLCVVDFTAVTSSDDTRPPAHGVWAAEGMAADAYAAVQAAFDDAKKKNQLKGALRIVSEDDPDAQHWGTVSPVLTRRLRSMASASLSEIARCLDVGSDAGLPQVFTAPLTDYDFVIKLDRDAVCRRHEQPPRAAFETADDVDGSDPTDGAAAADGEEVFKNLVLAAQPQGTPQGENGSLPRVKQHGNPFGQPGVVGFDPVALFVRDLVNVYRDALLVFSDVHGGAHIAGLWNPAIVRQPVPFVAAMQANMQPVSGQAPGSRPIAVGNTAAMLEEIIRLGDGLIADVVVQTK
ncbi:U3 snoRNP protein, partial [Coemansia spiralis]